MVLQVPVPLIPPMLTPTPPPPHPHPHHLLNPPGGSGSGNLSNP